jgi:diadenosine tetraphosphatase ApaH/serine/threonine PP2A family protein phosphatase
VTTIAVIADVHGNLPALEAVVEHAGEVDGWWCAGDTVGYGPFPNECVSLVSGLEAAAVVGNHDLGSIGAISIERFNREARIACEWTEQVLDPSWAALIKGLDVTRVECAGEALLLHGSPRDPIWEYVLSREQAYRGFLSLENHVCFHGHSHSPAVFTWPHEAQAAGDRDALTFLVPGDGESIELRDDAGYLVNAGSVGQPRDGDPRSCYVIFEVENRLITFHRVPYDIGRTQAEMEAAGLPAFLVTRLALGR